MGSDRTVVRWLSDPHGRSAGDGERLPGPAEDRLPAALSAEGVRPLADRAELARPVSRGWGLDGCGRPADAGRAPPPRPPGRAPDGHPRQPERRVVRAAARRAGRVDGNKRIEGIERHVLTCSLGLVPAVLVTAADLHDTAAAAVLLDRAAADGWAPQRLEADGIYVGARMAAAAERHALDVQVTSREPGAKGFKPPPLRWRIEATFGTQTNRYRRLTRNLEQSPTAAEDAVAIANCHRVLRAYTRNT